MATKYDFLASYQLIKTEYERAKSKVDKAIEHEELARPYEAMAAYEECLQIVDDIFKIPVELPESLEAVQSEWNDACQIIQQLKAIKMQLNNRLQNLRQQHVTTSNSSTVDGPLSSVVETKTTHTYNELIAGLRQLIAKPNTTVSFDTLFQAQTKLYRINGQRGVSTLAGDTSMSLVMINVGGEYAYLNGMFFIQCAIGNERSEEPSTSSNSQNMIWIYLLMPNLTTCYRTDYGAFIFPDIESNEAGAAFGLMLCPPPADATDEEQLEDIQQFFVDLLEAVLAGQVATLVPPPEALSERVSKGIQTAADMVARNMIWGAEKTGELMMRGTPHVIKRLRPAGSDPAPVSGTLQTSVEVAKTVTGAAAGVTSWVASKVGSASVAIGRYLTPHIQTQGSKLLEKGFGYDSTEANSKMEGALTIAAGALEGFTTVFNSLETSAKILGTSLSENSVKIIEHKYGAPAAHLATDTFDTFGNAFNVSQNVNYITPKGLAKKMAKNTGKAVIVNYQRNQEQTMGQVPAHTLYPDLRQIDISKESQ